MQERQAGGEAVRPSGMAVDQVASTRRREDRERGAQGIDRQRDRSQARAFDIRLER